MPKFPVTGLERTQIQELLTAAFTLCCLDPTLTASTLDVLVSKARANASQKVKQLDPGRRVIVDLDALGHVVYLWQRRPNYLDNDGQPKPIPARGPAPSIEALFREMKRSRYFELGLKHLIAVRRIRRLPSRRYIPCSEVTIVEKLTPEMVKLLSQIMTWFVSTVMSNTSQRDAKALRLIERVTMIPDLPLKQERAFKIFAREQGAALINTVNEWLESRRGNRTARSTTTSRNVTAGLHVFAFVQPNRRRAN